MNWARVPCPVLERGGKYCPGPWASPGYVVEYMSGGSGDDGSVAAETTNCSQDPGEDVAVAPGGTFTTWATFHNVPWPGSAVAIHWGDAGVSPAVYPFGTSEPSPAPAPTPTPTPTPKPSPPAHVAKSGKACVFNAPATGFHLVGHVGWGFELTGGDWEFGANEGPRWSTLISKTWYAIGTWQQMLNAFRYADHFHTAGYYTQYKCATVNTRSANIATAGQVVGGEYNQTYYPPTHDCESQAYNVLAAYGVHNLPSDIAFRNWTSPNHWFSGLTGARFGAAMRL